MKKYIVAMCIMSLLALSSCCAPAQELVQGRCYEHTAVRKWDPCRTFRVDEVEAPYYLVTCMWGCGAYGCVTEPNHQIYSGYSKDNTKLTEIACPVGMEK